MADKQTARTEGYIRGLEGKDSYSSWGSSLADATKNESGSSEARWDAYHEGLRDRARYNTPQISDSLIR